jgi:hypothetical protein
MNKNRPRIKNARALSWLVILLVGLGVGYRMMKETVKERPFDAPPWLAVGVIFISVLALILSYQESASSDGPEPRPAFQLPHFLSKWLTFLGQHGRLVAFALAFLFLAYTLYRIPALILPDNSFRGLFIIWTMAFGLYLLALAPPLAAWQWDWQRWWPLHKQQAIAISGLILLALLLRVWQLETIPFTLAGDEGSQGLEAIRVLEGQIRNPFTTGWLGVPTMSFFYNSITIRLFGRTILGLRLPWALVGTAAVLITFFLVKRLKNKQLGFIAAFLVATYHYHIHFSRLGSNQIADPFFMALTLFFLYRALDERRWLDWALTGGVAGLAFYFYAGARLTAVVLLVVIGYEFIRRPRQFWQQHRTGLLLLIGGFLLIAGPIIQYAIRFPHDFNARLNTVGILQSGWLENEVVTRQQSIASILFDQFRRAALAFNYYSDRTVWYGLRQPLLGPFFGTLFLLGLILSMLRLWGRTADHRSAPMVAWWWGGMLLGGMLTESPPSSQRLITLAIPVCFFIGLALWELLQLAGRAIRGLPVKGLMLLAILIFAINSLTIYFVDYTPQRIYGGHHAELATEIAPQLLELSPDHRIYFVGPPWMYWGFATLPYLVPRADAVDILNSFADPLTWDSVTLDKPAVFVFLPERLDELVLVQRSLPSGERFNYFSPVDNRLLASLYIVPSAVP